MSLESYCLGSNIYKASNASRSIFYAPFKNIVLPCWKIGSSIQLAALRLISDEYTVPDNAVKATVLELDMCHKCSLSCIYCSVNSNSNDKRVKMTFDLAKVGIDRVVKNSQETNDPFAIVFIGKGEPTLNWKTLLECVDYIENLKKKEAVKGKTIIVTNGVLSPERVKWLANNIDHIALSWDGDMETQNLQRPFVSGRGSYSCVERTASILKEESAYFEIRTTWTSFNVGKMVEFTKKFISYKPFELNYQPLLQVGRAKTTNMEISKPMISTFVTNFMESKKLAAQHGIEVMMPSVETKRLNRKFCHAYEGSGFHLIANGLVTACECVFSEDEGCAGKHLVYGKIIKGSIEIDKEKLSVLKTIRVDNVSKCQECFARWHCAGGCLNTHFQESEDPNGERKHSECEITREIVWQTLNNIIFENKERG